MYRCFQQTPKLKLLKEQCDKIQNELDKQSEQINQITATNPLAWDREFSSWEKENDRLYNKITKFKEGEITSEMLKIINTSSEVSESNENHFKVHQHSTHVFVGFPGDTCPSIYGKLPHNNRIIAGIYCNSKSISGNAVIVTTINDGTQTITTSITSGEKK